MRLKRLLSVLLTLLWLAGLGVGASAQEALTPAEGSSADWFRFSGKLSSKEDGLAKVKGSDNGREVTYEFRYVEESPGIDEVDVDDRVVVEFTKEADGSYKVSRITRLEEEAIFPEHRLPQAAVAKAPAEPTPTPATEETPRATPRPDPGPEPSSSPDEGPALSDEGSPRIVNIEIEGNAHVPADEILAVISTRIGDPLLEPRIRRDMQAIFDMGYFTDVRLDTRYAPGGVRLVFRVLENPVVNSINVTGNEVVTSDKLLGLLETRPGQILNTRTLHADIQNLNKYYDEDLGYLLTPTHVIDLSFEQGALNIKLQDGMKVTAITITGVTVFPLEQVEALVHVKPGDLFNQKVIKEDSAAIAKLYEQNDYILDTVRPTVDAEKGTVTLNVQEAVCEEIRVEGNVRTTTDTILKQLRTKPGQVLQKRRIQKDLERLNNLGFFKKVDINPEPGTEPGKVILVLDVEEQKTGLATIGIGYAGGGTGAVRPGVTGAVSFSDRNLFGRGKTASIQIQKGAQITSIGVNYLDPAINDNQDSLGAALFYNEVNALRQPVTVNGVTDFALYDDRRYGGSLTYGHPFTDDLRGFITLRQENIDITQNPSSAYTIQGLSKGSLNAIGLSALYDTRDDVFAPHVGSFLNGAVTYAGLGGTFNFTKFTVEGRHYLPLSDRQTIALRVWAGTVNGPAIPITEFFYAGGVDTMRGYLQNQFFGTRFLVLNAEYRFPIGGIKFLNGAVFADAGNAWIPGQTSSALHADGGIGLRITFPTLNLGVIRVDYAFGELGGRASIGIGQSF